MKNSCIHIGLHHAGSTFIQGELLPKLKKITPITFHQNTFLNKEFLYLCQASEMYYNNEYEKKVKNLLKEKKNIFISSEGLSGTRYNVYTSCYTNKSIAERLKNIFIKPKILIGIRNQKSIIESFYKETVRYGYLSNYEFFFRENLRNNQFDIFKYSKLIKFYMDFFGNENVYVYLYENFFDINKTKNLLISMGIDPEGIEDVDFNRRLNSSYSPLSHNLSFLFNRFFGSKLSYGVSFGKDPRLFFYNFWRYKLSKVTDKISYSIGYKNIKLNFSNYAQILYDQFHEDNLELSKLLDINLQDKGYI